ncbi:MAG: hypothetical protein H7Z11_24030 [Verrucomicrobia bacterium]|nr:hypothetical protein [Leptolyngbya sp. ES-bin-22]
MAASPCHDQLSLEDQAVRFGKQAVELGLISSFVVPYFPDAWVFYVPKESQSEPLTPEEAYLHLKQLVMH